MDFTKRPFFNSDKQILILFWDQYSEAPLGVNPPLVRDLCGYASGQWPSQKPQFVLIAPPLVSFSDLVEVGHFAGANTFEEGSSKI